jgi:RNA polymerase subunit RPABC4/transcription elongation factor Spt4
MPGYKKPCRHCGKLAEPDAKVCPFCGTVEPAGPPRCPKCRSPIQKGTKFCGSCSFSLEITCGSCGKVTFPDTYCEHCGNKVAFKCPNPKCGYEQIMYDNKCIKCGKNLK